MSEYIRISGWPPTHAKIAFDNGYYLEALQTLHGWLECKLRELLLMQRTLMVEEHDGWSKAWDVSNEFTLNNAAKALLVIGALSEEEQGQITRFNRVRNNLVHKLFFDPYDEHWKGVPMSECKNAFNLGLELAEQVESKSSQAFMKGDSSIKSIESEVP